MNMDDTILLKMAEAEILGEAKRAAIRHSIAGISGWQPCPKPNKTFLTNTLLQTMASNRILDKDKKIKGKKGLKSNKNDRKFLQKSSKTDLTTNYIYQKPKKSKKKPIFSSKKSVKSSENSRIKSEDRHSKNVKEKYNKKVKLKKYN